MSTSGMVGERTSEEPFDDGATCVTHVIVPTLSLCLLLGFYGAAGAAYRPLQNGRDEASLSACVVVTDASISGLDSCFKDVLALMSMILALI